MSKKRREVRGGGSNQYSCSENLSFGILKMIRSCLSEEISCHYGSIHYLRLQKNFISSSFSPISLSPLISANILILFLLKGNYLSSSIFQNLNFHCRSNDYSQPPFPSLLFFLIPSNIISSLHSYHFSLPPLLSNPSLRGIIPLQSYSPHYCFYFFLHFCSMFLFH